MYRIKLKSINGRAGELILENDKLPLGLDNLELTLGRHSKYHGIFQSISSSLTFLCGDGGYEYILAAYNERGIDTILGIDIYVESCNTEMLFYTGYINIEDIEFNGAGAVCSIRPSNCINLLMDRAGVNVNIYDEPCIKQLTFDKTNALRRYVYAPYLVNFPEKKILGWAQGELNTETCQYGTDPNFETIVTADFFVGLGSVGKTAFICDGNGIPAPCTFNPACDNYTEHPTNATTGFYKARVQEARIRNFPPIKWLNNDLDFANEFDPCSKEGSKMDYVASNPPIPQLPFDYGQGHTGWIQEFRREQYEIVPPSIRFDLAECGSYSRCFRETLLEEDTLGEKDQYQLEPEERLISVKCDCQEIKIKCRAVGKQKVYFFASQGATPSAFPNPIVEYVRTTTRARIFVLRKTNLYNPTDLWSDLTETYALSPVLTTGTWVDPLCNPLTLGFEHYFYNAVADCGILAGFAYFTVGSETTWEDFDTGDLEFHFQNCDLRKGDCLFFALETDISTIIDNGPVVIRSVVKFEQVNVDILYSTCDNVGETNVESFGVHEALARLVEYYTNNCLTVRTSYFGRSNSLEGADDVDFQTEPSCDPLPPNCPSPDIFSTEYLQSFQTGAHSNAVCSEDGCGAYEIITSGNLLRNWTKGCFTNFNDLYQSLDAIHNIGMGWTEFESDAVRIERYEYFYNDNVILEIEIDLIKSKFTRRVYSENFYKQYIGGYTDRFIKDYVNSIDEFNTRREYVLPITNTSNSIDKRSVYIASGYTIEYQRRQRYSNATDFDSDMFIVCVTPDMLEVEVGINNPTWCGLSLPNYPQSVDGIIDPNSTYNFRIRPSYNAARNFSFMLPSLHRASVKEMKFSFGEVHYNISGDEPLSLPGCDVGYDYVNNNDFSTCENADINEFWLNNPALINQKIVNEIVEFNYPLTPAEMMLLRKYPYSKIKVNGELFYIQTIKFNMNKSSNLKLIKAY